MRGGSGGGTSRLRCSRGNLDAWTFHLLGIREWSGQQSFHSLFHLSVSLPFPALVDIFALTFFPCPFFSSICTRQHPPHRNHGRAITEYFKQPA